MSGTAVGLLARDSHPDHDQCQRLASRQGGAMEDTWWSRDLPVLDAAVQLFQEQDFVEAGELARATGFDVKDVARALRDMQGHYVGQIQSMGDMDRWCITEVTPEARRAVGQWPTPENVVDRLAEAFTAAAEHE